MFVTLFGIVTIERLVQLLMAFSPMLVNPLGNIMLVSPLQSLNASVPRLVMQSPTTAVVIAEAT